MTPERGMLLVLADEQYRFGVGPVLCRVVDVIAEVIFDETPWWHLRAECANGTPQRHGGWQLRELYVVASAVHGGPRPRGPGRGNDQP